MDIEINACILHILDSENAIPVLSDICLDVNNDEFDRFIQKQISKLYNDDTSKRGYVKSTSHILDIMKSQESFIDKSRQLASNLFKIMIKHTSIPAADLLVIDASINHSAYIVLLKMNYKSAFTHFVENNAAGIHNKVILHKTLFPNDRQQIEEGALLNVADLSCSIIEKPFNLNGDISLYFSTKYLECDVEKSAKESISIIQKCSDEVTRKYNPTDDTELRLNKYIYNALDQEGKVDVNELADEVFEGEEAKQAFLNQVETLGVKEQIAFKKENSQKKFSVHKIKTASGIEVTIPISIINNKNEVEFVNRPDGKVEIVVRNIN